MLAVHANQNYMGVLEFSTFQNDKHIWFRYFCKCIIIGILERPNFVRCITP